MNLSLLVNIMNTIILGATIYAAILIYTIINREYMEKHRRLIFHLITILWVLILLVIYPLYLIVNHYLPVEPYTTTIQAQGHNLTVIYTPMIGVSNDSLMDMIMLLMVMGVVAVLAYDDAIHDIDMERCEKGEA